MTDNSAEAGFGGGNLVGGGGYTGSPGDGVSGATCYADTSVTGFTDLGTSNSAGYVTVSLIDPVPIKQISTWNEQSKWDYVNSFLPYTYSITYCDGIKLFFAVSNFESSTFPQMAISSDGKIWINSSQDFSNMSSCMVPLVSSDKVVVYGNKTTSDGVSWKNNNLPINVALPPNYNLVPGNNNTYNNRAVYLNGQFILQIYSNSSSYEQTILTSVDGFSWNIVTTTTDNITIKAYANGIYVGIKYSSELVYSENLIDWTSTSIFNITDVTFGNKVFIAVRTSDPNDAGVYKSNNGTDWTFESISQVIPFQNYGGQIYYANGSFIVFAVGVNDPRWDVEFFSYTYFSPDGDNWYLSYQKLDQRLLRFGGTMSFANSNTLGFLMILTGWGDLPYVTIKGDYVVSLVGYFSQTLIDVCYAPEIKTMVAVDWENNLYTNTNKGIGDWIRTPTVLWYELSYLCYSKELGKLFFYNCRQDTSQYPSPRIVQTYTWSGTEWTDHGITYRVEGGLSFQRPFWCKELGYFTNGSTISRDGIYWTKMSDSILLVYAYHGVFVSVGSSYPGYKYGDHLYYSSDGYNWTLCSYPYSDCQFWGVVWCPKLNVFVGTGIRNGNYFCFISSNGIDWTETTSTIGGKYITWSPELEKLYVFHDNYVSESTDGKTWSLPTQLSIKIFDDSYSGLNWYSGLDAFITFHRTELLTSSNIQKTF